jgi:hypothetical protein
MTVTVNGIREWKTAQKRNYIARVLNSNPCKLPEFYDFMVTIDYRNKTLISGGRLNLEKLTIFQLLHKNPAFHEPENSIPNSEQSITSPYTKAGK